MFSASYQRYSKEDAGTGGRGDAGCWAKESEGWKRITVKKRVLSLKERGQARLPDLELIELGLVKDWLKVTQNKKALKTKD